MKSISLQKLIAAFALFFVFSNLAAAQSAAKSSSRAVSQIQEKDVRAEMEFLASDAMQGRGSGTQFELLAGEYIASQLKQFGVEPAGADNAAGGKSFIQTVSIARTAFASNPKLSYSINGQPVTLEHGKEMLVLRMNTAQISGAVQKISSDETPKPGAIAFVKLKAGEGDQNLARSLQGVLTKGASAVIVEETPAIRAQWSNFSSRPISFTSISGGIENKAAPSNIIVLSKEEADKLAQTADGTAIEIKGELAAPQIQNTYNAVGKLTGSDKNLSPEIILLSAHMDHLGIRANAPGSDKIYNGADDDASGCVAVLEMARVLSRGTRPKRTVYFVFFGSEEAGGYGAQYFVNNLPFPKENLVANLEFEMIGRPDDKVKPDELWLTGYERSNLGPELARRGAKLVQDPHPEQNFFQRSDNYTLARQGIIAHTVSSFGLHTDYHQASDEVKTINFSHMTHAINSMVAPVKWLVNSNFKPQWVEGKKP